VKTLFILFSILLIPHKTNAFVTELSGDIGYQKQVYGTNRENSVVTVTGNGSVAFYIWNNTALEINYSQSQRDDDSNTNYTIGLTKITKRIDHTDSKVYGLGLRQAFAGKNATIRPTLSLGYARQFDSSYIKFNYTDLNSSIDYKDIRLDNASNEVNSVFATLALNIKLTQYLSLRSAVNTVFEAFKFNKAKDYLKYSAGFTWFF